MYTAPSAFFLQAYEAFMMDVGLGGNIFEWDYTNYGKPAEHSWFCLLWELCHKYKVQLCINQSHHVPLTRVGVAPTMALLIETGIFSIAQLCTLNRF